MSYLPQPGTAKVKRFSHDFEGFFPKQNVEVKKGIGLRCPDFFIHFDGAIYTPYSMV